MLGQPAPLDRKRDKSTAEQPAEAGAGLLAASAVRTCALACSISDIRREASVLPCDTAGAPIALRATSQPHDSIAWCVHAISRCKHLIVDVCSCAPLRSVTGKGSL